MLTISIGAKLAQSLGGLIDRCLSNGAVIRIEVIMKIKKLDRNLDRRRFFCGISVDRFCTRISCPAILKFGRELNA